MPDTVTSQTLLDGARIAVMHFTNQSDGTGESAVTKVDVSELGDAPSEVKIRKITYATQGMGLKILWGATTDVLAFTVPADDAGEIVFDPPLVNNAGTGKTGDIKFTTVGQTSGDSYAVTLHLIKKE
jgi:hypothetical protein